MFYPPPITICILFTTYKIVPLNFASLSLAVSRITTPKNVSLDANVSMGPIVADGVVENSLLVTGRGGRLRGVIANNKAVIQSFSPLTLTFDVGHRAS